MSGEKTRKLDTLAKLFQTMRCSVANWYIYIPNSKNVLYFHSAWYIIF